MGILTSPFPLAAGLLRQRAKSRLVFERHLPALFDGLEHLAIVPHDIEPRFYGRALGVERGRFPTGIIFSGINRPGAHLFGVDRPLEVRSG